MTRDDPAMRRLHEGRKLSAIAAKLGINRQATYSWKRVPALRVLKVAEITGMKPHELRPDIYPAPMRPRKQRRKHNGR